MKRRRNSDQPATIISATAEALATGGSCVATVSEPSDLAGLKAFIPYTVPGESVTGAVTLKKKSFVEADLVAVKTPSSHRQQPPCPIFMQCGGCNLQHVKTAHQREMKREMIEKSLLIQGGIKAENGVVLIGADLNDLYYRKRISLHINRDRQLGFFRRDSRQIVPADHCYIATKAINDLWKRLYNALLQTAPEVETITFEDHNGALFIILELHHRSVDALETLKAKPALREIENGVDHLQINFRHKAVYVKGRINAEDTPPIGHFSQNNDEANELLVEEVVKAATGTYVTDLYAGAGNLSIPLSQAGKIVTAVEVDSKLVAFGKTRAEQLGLIERLTFIEKSCEKWIEKNTPADVVVIDPPRGGARAVAENLDPGRSKKLVYVSCFPPTFMRDAQILTGRGYRLTVVSVLDMFPQTYHAEVIGIFEA